MAELEGPDEYITLRRAGELCGISAIALGHQARKGKLETRLIGRDRLTTRRLLHRYLKQRGPGGRPAPLSPDYPQVEGEEQIG